MPNLNPNPYPISTNNKFNLTLILTILTITNKSRTENSLEQIQSVPGDGKIIYDGRAYVVFSWWTTFTSELVWHAKMPRPRSAGSDGSDIDADGLAEQELELAKLRQQYRLLENDRKAYAQESQDMLKKQKYVKASLCLLIASM